MLLIDEIETSLHPRTQRRLMRDLATIARLEECQIVVTTHSPYILDELPPEGRVFIMDGAAGKTIIPGVSVEFAMTQMDDEPTQSVKFTWRTMSPRYCCKRFLRHKRAN